MTNVLLSKAYKGQKAGSLLTGVSDKDARAIKALGLGSEVKDEASKPKGKSEKPVA